VIARSRGLRRLSLGASFGLLAPFVHALNQLSGGIEDDDRKAENAAASGAVAVPADVTNSGAGG